MKFLESTVYQNQKFIPYYKNSYIAINYLNIREKLYYNNELFSTDVYKTLNT